MVASLVVAISNILMGGNIVWLDLVLSGDNALVIGVAAAGLVEKQRHLAIIIGMAGAIILRIAFCLLTVNLYNIGPLQLIGGILLAWIAFKLFWDTIKGGSEDLGYKEPTNSLVLAIFTILLADISMSLDNILAISAIAGTHYWALGFGLALSIAICGFAAEAVSRILSKQHWLTIAASGAIAYISYDMIHKSWPMVMGWFSAVWH